MWCSSTPRTSSRGISGQNGLDQLHYWRQAWNLMYSYILRIPKILVETAQNFRPPSWILAAIFDFWSENDLLSLWWLKFICKSIKTYQNHQICSLEYFQASYIIDCAINFWICCWGRKYVRKIRNFEQKIWQHKNSNWPWWKLCARTNYWMNSKIAHVYKL